MTTPVIVAAELKDLLPADPMPGYDVRWLRADEPTPRGPHPAIVPLLTRRMGASEFDGLPELRVVANCAVGVDNVDLREAGARRIVVTNTPEVLTDATADLTWALILAVTRRLKEGQQLIAAGRWKGWHPTELLGMELRGLTLGLVGAGRIGQAVGRRALGFGLRLMYSDRVAMTEFEQETGATRADLDELLAASDVVSLHLPSSKKTQGIIDAKKLSLMKGAVLVNTARGDLIDENALIEAIENGSLRGAGLDVFPAEPTVNPALVAHPRVVVLPHIGSATTATREGMASLAVRNAAHVLAGKAPITPIAG